MIVKYEDMLSKPEETFYDLIKFVNNIIIDHDFDIVLSDQSVDAEIEFARAICLKETKPFLRIWPDFLDRRSIFKEGKFGQSDVVEAVIDEHFSYEMAENYLNEYLQKKSASYSPTVFFSNSSYLDKIRAYLSDYRLPIITILKMIIMKIIRESGKPFYYFENIRKNILNDKFDKDLDLIKLYQPAIYNLIKAYEPDLKIRI